MGRFECRLKCPVEIWSLCCLSPVKMVYSFLVCLTVIFCCVVVLIRLQLTARRLCAVPELEAEGFGSGGIVQNRLMCEVRVADERIGRWKPPGRCCERSEADFAASVECSSSKGLRASSLSTYTKLNARQNAKIPSETLITATLCCALVFCFSVIFIFQFATSFLSAVRSDRHTLCQTSA